MTFVYADRKEQPIAMAIESRKFESRAVQTNSISHINVLHLTSEYEYRTALINEDVAVVNGGKS